jgi:hypothetical protein
MFSEWETPVCLLRFFGDVRPGQITVDGQALLLRMTAPQYELHGLTILSWGTPSDSSCCSLPWNDAAIALRRVLAH